MKIVLHCPVKTVTEDKQLSNDGSKTNKSCDQHHHGETSSESFTAYQQLMKVSVG